MAEYRGKKYSKKNQATSEQAVVEAILRGLWSVIKFPFTLKKGAKSSGRINPAVAIQLAQHWDGIGQYLHNPATYSVAVTEGDKLLDAAFQAASFSGNNMGERLQTARPVFESALYQRIWDAHKMRNMIAHQVGTTISQAEAQASVYTFQAALRVLGVPV